MNENWRSRVYANFVKKFGRGSTECNWFETHFPTKGGGDDE